MATVEAKKGESVGNLLRRFQHEVLADGILREYKKHQFFVSESGKRREKSRLARVRQRKLKRRREIRKNPFELS